MKIDVNDSEANLNRCVQRRFRKYFTRHFFGWSVLVFSCLPLAHAESHAEFQVPSYVANKPLFSPAEIAWIAAHRKVYVAVDSDWRPLEYVEGRVHKGLTAEYLDAISKISGLQFQVLPSAQWGDAQQSLIDQRIDLLPAVSKQFASDKLKNAVIFTEPYFVGSTIIVSTAAEPIIFDARKLNGKVVALKGGGAYERLLRQHFPEIKVMPVANPEAALQAVADGYADAAFGVGTAMQPLLRRKFLGTLHISGTIADMPATVSMGIRKNLPELASIIEKSLNSLSAAQTDDMTEKWLQSTDYGAPSLSTLLKYYATELMSLVIGGLLILWFAQYANAARRQAVRSEQEKAHFLAVMSHEIRTPMNAILSSVELLQRSPLDSRQHEMASLAGSAAEALLGLLDDVLDLSKLEAHRLQLEQVPTDIAVLAQQSIAMMQVKVREKNISIYLDVQVPENTAVLIDPTRVRQILLNLLSNAVKFTHQGGITVIIRLQVDALMAAQMTGINAYEKIEAKQSLNICVSDTGIGISQDQQSKLFQPFTQADSSTTRRYGGTGLGLVICRELVKIMQGTLVLQSEVGVGTSISFTIPVTTQLQVRDGSNTNIALGNVQPSAAAKASLKNKIITERPTILVVDDHASNRLVITRQLEELGCDAVMAEDGPSALALIATRVFPLVLLDCYLPGMDGYEVARIIRKKEEGSERHLPIIAISAAVDSGHEQRCIENGMDGMLRKPLRLEKLKTIIEVWCDVALILQDHAHTPETLNSLFRASTEQDLANIEQALSLGDYHVMAQYVHRVKGAALMVDEHTIVTAAESVERILADGDQVDAQKLHIACVLLRKRAQQL